MNIAISGATGLLGRAMIPVLEDSGHRMIRLVRRAPGPGEIGWDPESGLLEPAAVPDLDAVLHFAAENVATGRWSAAKKARIRASRVLGTGSLCHSLARLARPPRCLVCASAVGYYGDRAERILAENEPPGNDYLADVVREWENAAMPAVAAGIRVVPLRLGLVLSQQGGVLTKMLLPFRLGFGGRLGHGRQYWSWISIHDVVGIVHHVLATDALAGPVNATSPNPVTNRQFAAILGRVLSRPALVPVPAWVLRILLGEMAESLILTSIRAWPDRLLESGYRFQYPELEPALRDLLQPVPS